MNNPQEEIWAITFRKVYCKDRFPQKDGWYSTDGPFKELFMEGKWITRTTPIWWIEETAETKLINRT